MSDAETRIRNKIAFHRSKIEKYEMALQVILEVDAEEAASSGEAKSRPRKAAGRPAKKRTAKASAAKAAASKNTAPKAADSGKPKEGPQIKERILDLLKSRDTGLHSKEIIRELGVTRKQLVYTALNILKTGGSVEQDEVTKVYGLPSEAVQPTA